MRRLKRNREIVVIGAIVGVFGLEEFPLAHHDGGVDGHPLHAPGNRLAYATMASTLQSGGQVFASVTVDNTELTRGATSLKLIHDMIDLSDLEAPPHPATRR